MNVSSRPDLPPEQTHIAGTRLVEQGEPALEAYLIMEGSAVVHHKKGDEILVLATLHEGDIFGEAALFKGSDYGASVIAGAEGIRVQPIPPAVLDDKIARCDPMIRALIRMLMVRLRETNKKRHRDH